MLRSPAGLAAERERLLDMVVDPARFASVGTVMCTEKDFLLRIVWSGAGHRDEIVEIDVVAVAPPGRARR